MNTMRELKEELKMTSTGRKFLEEIEPCEDAISKEDVIKAVDHHTFDTNDGLCLDEDISIILEEVAPKQDSILSEARAKIAEQEKWLAEAGCNAYNVSIAFESIKRALKK